ncbi:MAG: hypothetical protein ACI8Y7_001033 [Candidatus Woesearchaeota archaeon]|jgi:hypothetical protein
MRHVVTAFKEKVAYNKDEFIVVFLFSVILGFLFSAKTLFTEAHHVFVSDFIITSAVALIIVFFFTLVMKMTGVVTGVYPIVTVSHFWLVVAVILALMSRGFIIIFIPPGFLLHASNRMLLGRKPGEPGLREQTMMAVLSICSLIVLALFVDSMNIHSQVQGTFVSMAYMYAIYSLVPFDFATKMMFENDEGATCGAVIFFKSRTIFVFMILFVLASLIGLFADGYIVWAAFAFIIAFLGAIIYYFKSEF